jgi:hypothetical protein
VDVCKKLSVAINALIRAFCAMDYVDLYRAEVDSVLAEVSAALDELAVLRGYVVNEAAVFPSLAGLPPAIAALCETARKIMVELEGLRTMLAEVSERHHCQHDVH